MSDFKLALIYLRSRLLVTVLTVISVGLGLGLATVVLILTRETANTLSKETEFYDIVVGAHGSPLQLTLNSLYYLDAPTGNIPVEVWHKLEKTKSVVSALPVSMGDSFNGAPIVGTVPEFFKDRKPRQGNDLLAQGHMFSKPFDVVVGASLARREQLKLGEKIISSHGWGVSGGELHTKFPYHVVGILAYTGTSLDRAVYTDYHDIWEIHKEPDPDEPDVHFKPEVTAVLVRLSQPGRRYQLLRTLNAEYPQAMAVIPVDEISKLSMTFIAPLQGILLIVAYLVVLVSALSILISLYLTIHQRRRDVAIMRSLGATQLDVFRLITLEAAALAGLGVILGWLLGHGLVAVIAPYSVVHYGIAPNAWNIQRSEFAIALSVWVLGVLAGLLPAAMAYQLSVAETLVNE